MVQSFVSFVVLWPLQLNPVSGSHSLTIKNGPAPASSHFSSHSPSFAFQAFHETPVKCIMNILLILMEKVTGMNSRNMHRSWNNLQASLQSCVKVLICICVQLCFQFVPLSSKLFVTFQEKNPWHSVWKGNLISLCSSVFNNLSVKFLQQNPAFELIGFKVSSNRLKI